MSAISFSPVERIERRLLILAALFLGLYSLGLTLSNAVHMGTWQVSYRWAQWLGFAAWAGVVWLAQRQLARRLPDHDPYLFPVAALLSGWGLLTIWRLDSILALRQTAWLVLIGTAFMLALRYDCQLAGGRILSYLQRFKYVWLTTGLVLTAATLFLGTNPLGAGPRLWLGCCGVYFQPSEPLKLLLVIYLAAYLADRQVGSGAKIRLFPLLTPTLLMTGLALLLLVFQRDLGTAAIFMALYAVIVYAGTGKKKVLIASLVIMVVAGAAGYLLFDVVTQRVDAWINPWIDPSGRSYQIVQSLLAVANGGIFGRGPGMGSPNMVPIAQSDFIFSAISEETGLLGALGILGLLIVLVNRGMRIALKAGDTFQRLLAIGLVAHLVGQSILIIAGNLRLLPLTGVTLPFMSNGGSSLLVSYIELLCLLLISGRMADARMVEVDKLKAQARINVLISGGLMLGLAGAALTGGWWSLVRESDLLNRTDNPRRSIADSYVLRGSILDRSEQPLAESSGERGTFTRQYPYPALGPLLGYTSPMYGQAGLEASLDTYLRGERGYPTLTMAWERLLYGQPPPGLDVRLSLDLDLQIKADQLLMGRKGAIVLLNASTGEVLAMASSPGFDANTLDTNWENLINNPDSPLLNRATMGMYPPGDALGVFLLAGSKQNLSSQLEGINTANCALEPGGNTLGQAIAAGCSEATEQLAASIDSQELVNMLANFGLYTAPNFPMETLTSPKPEAIQDIAAYLGIDKGDGNSLKVSPLQMALAAASMTNGGQIYSPRLAMAVQNPNGGWVMLPVSSAPKQAQSSQEAINSSQSLADTVLPIWQEVAVVKNANPIDGSSGYSWYLGGTLGEWKGAPLAIAVLLEQNDAGGLQKIGQSLLNGALYP